MTIRPYEERDIEKILALQTQLYPDTRWSELWFRWKYQDNPHNQSIFMLAENDAGDLVGMRGLWPRRYSLGEKVWLAYQPTDTGVLANYRGQGLFKQLTQAALSLAASVGGTLIFNFPNPASLPGYLSMGWIIQRRLRWWTRPWPLSFSRRRMDVPSSHNANRDHYNFVRDDSFVEWRFKRHPSVTYNFLELGSIGGTPVKAVTTMVIRQRVRQQLLIDIIGADGADLERDELLGSLVRQTLRIGGIFTVLEGTLGYSSTLLYRHGFIPLPRMGVNFVTLDRRPNAETSPIFNFNITPGVMDTF